MKYVVEVIEIENPPSDLYSVASWPKSGLYMIKGVDTSAYLVSKEHSFVSFVSYPMAMLDNSLKENDGAVSESLLLKAIAAAASRQLAV